MRPLTLRPSRIVQTASIASASIAFAAAPALAQTAEASFEIPRIKASNYRKPYVAAWLEDADRKAVRMVQVMFDQSPIGDNWLPDLKTWWRRGGRAMKTPVAGVTRPTRGPGAYKIKVGSMADLPAGEYALVFEAVREKGGREVVKLPFDWAPGKPVKVSASGSTELGNFHYLFQLLSLCPAQKQTSATRANFENLDKRPPCPKQPPNPSLWLCLPRS